MRELIDRPEWVAKQYQDDRNLNARIALHQRFSTSTVNWQRWVFDHIQERLAVHGQTPVRVLEVGAGPAMLWSENRDRIPAHWEVMLSDLSPGMAASAQRNLGQAGVAARLLVAGAEEIPVAAASCHAVVANHMLYHVKDRARALREICRVLRPDGVLFAATNGERHMTELHELAHRFEPSLPAEDPTPRRFSLESGERQLAEHFAHVSVQRKQNRLVVTEAEPLVAYMLSGSPAAIGPEQEAALRAFVAIELAERGTIDITPDTGLLVAQGPLAGLNGPTRLLG